jgi:hypothetical protein
MHPYSIEELAWLRLQDMQREAENRRLLVPARPSATMAAWRRLLDRTRNAVELRKTRLEAQSAAAAECR